MVVPPSVPNPPLFAPQAPAAPAALRGERRTEKRHSPSLPLSLSVSLSPGPPLCFLSPTHHEDGNNGVGSLLGGRDPGVCCANGFCVSAAGIMTCTRTRFLCTHNALAHSTAVSRRRKHDRIHRSSEVFDIILRRVRSHDLYHSITQQSGWWGWVTRFVFGREVRTTAVTSLVWLVYWGSGHCKAGPAAAACSLCPKL